jgi:hypothetical protein
LLSATHTRTTPEPTTNNHNQPPKRTQFGSKRGTAAPPDSSLFLVIHITHTHTHTHTTHLYSCDKEGVSLAPDRGSPYLLFSVLRRRVRILLSLSNCATCVACPRPPCDRHLRPSDV